MIENAVKIDIVRLRNVVEALHSVAIPPAPILGVVVCEDAE